jgi:hypothetical protein
MCLAAVHTIANDLPENELSKPTFRTVSERVGRYLEESSTRVASGFSLNGGVVADAHERKKLERLCRYITRPAALIPKPRAPPDVWN